MPFIKAAQKSELEPGNAKTVEAEGNAIALFNVNGEFFALDNTCPHRGGPLGEGLLDGNIITCPWHAWEFDVKNGECKTNPAVIQKKFNVKVEGEDVLVEI